MSFQPKFWKPGDATSGAPLSEERVVSGDDGEGAGSYVIYNQFKNLSIENQRQRLPAFQYRNHILHLLELYSTVIIVGETGSGKSTQIPQYLLEAGWAADGWMVAVTQPRRVATVTVAARVAEERATLLGEEVGYAIRFDQRCHVNNTRIKFLTDGMLVRELSKDPLLSRYSVVMLDEAHERTQQTDIVIGLLKKVQKRRSDLRIIVASATLDAELFRSFFNRNDSGDARNDTAAVLSIEGRMFPVEIQYSIDPVADYVKAAVDIVLKIHQHESPGDVLVFLTGMDEVTEALKLLKEASRLANADIRLWILPMYGGLPIAEQMKVFARTANNTRKVVLATNIAETSVTIPGIVYVVDSGFVKMKAFNPTTGLEALVVVPTSKASAQQRAGRAGRTRSGKVYRLYTEQAWDTLAEATVPEMQRSDLAPVILLLKSLGIDNILRFNFLSRPPANNLVHGLELLYALGALDDDVKLTPDVGMKMTDFPLSPMFSKMLLASGEMGCSEEAATIAAMMQIENVFTAPSNQKIAADRAKRKFSVTQGDHLTMYNVYRAFIENKKSSSWCKENYLNYKALTRAIEIRDQITRLMLRADIPMASNTDADTLLRCITMGFFSNAAQLHHTGVYRTIRHDHTLHIHPTSVMYRETQPQFVLFGEVVHMHKEYMRDISVVDGGWLYELAPHYYEFGTERELTVKRTRVDKPS